MRYEIWSALVPLALASTALAAKVSLASLQRGGSLPGGAVPNRFIVELAAPLGNSKRDVVSREVRLLLARPSGLKLTSVCADT